MLIHWKYFAYILSERNMCVWVCVWERDREKNMRIDVPHNIVEICGIGSQVEHPTAHLEELFHVLLWRLSDPRQPVHVAMGTRDVKHYSTLSV